MATDEIDLVDEIFGLTPGEPAGRLAVPEPVDAVPEPFRWEPNSPTKSASSFELKPATGLWAPPVPERAHSRRGGRVIGFAALTSLFSAGFALSQSRSGSPPRLQWLRRQPRSLSPLWQWPRSAPPRTGSCPASTSGRSTYPA